MTRRNIPPLCQITFILTMVVLFCVGTAFAQTDPGVRGGAPGAGQPFASVSANPNDLALFNTGLAQFNETQTVT